MLSTLTRFIFPKLCLYCREVHEDRGLLCERCLTGLDLLSPGNRCWLCFQEGCWKRCMKQGNPWQRRGALFERPSSGEVLLADVDRFAKEIAAFFVVQYTRLGWEGCESFYVEKGLEPIKGDVKRWLNMRPVSRWRDYSGKRVLYFAKGDEIKIPKRLLGARIFLLTYML